MAKPAALDRPAHKSARSLSGLVPFLKPYRLQMGLALVFLVLAAASTLVFPLALRQLIDNGLQHPDKGAQAMALQGNFVMLFGVAVKLLDLLVKALLDSPKKLRRQFRVRE